MQADGTISIRINDEHRRVRDGLTLAELVTELGMAADGVIVERNLEMVPRTTLANVAVQDGDELEVARSVP